VNARPDLLERPLRSPSPRIKVGFVSSFFRECTIGHYFRSWLTGLDAGRFERIVMHTGGTHDVLTAALEQACDQFLPLRGSTTQVAEAIRAARLDVLIYPEIGMGAQNYLLANMRLAPIQIAAWGHPVTTGSSEIDYFLSCAGMEPANAQQHYRERLLLLPGIGVSYAMPISIAPVTRAQLGLTADRHIYVCPQSLFKIHPDNDDVFCALMARDENAILLFFQGNHAALTQQFSARLSERMKAHGLPQRNQVKFLPRMDAAGFRAVLSLADVVLDTLHWSGGNTSLDALAVGAPIVTLPGQFMRGRQTAAMLRLIGASELIATDRGQYVDIAIDVAHDRERREQLRETIVQNRGEVFDTSAPIRELESILRNVV
jgi:protein O-GlcNAc transferase